MHQLFNVLPTGPLTTLKLLPAQPCDLCFFPVELSVVPPPSLFLSLFVSARLRTQPLVPKIYVHHTHPR